MCFAIRLSHTNLTESALATVGPLARLTPLAPRAAAPGPLSTRLLLLRAQSRRGGRRQRLAHLRGLGWPAWSLVIRVSIGHVRARRREGPRVAAGVTSAVLLAGTKVKSEKGARPGPPPAWQLVHLLCMG